MALGVGLAMDAFSVSIANGLNEPHMRRQKTVLIAGTYGAFQFLMPVIGWFCVHTVARAFRAFQPFIPWIALALLLWIGGKMVLEGIRDIRAGGRKKQAKKKEPAAVLQSPASIELADAKGQAGEKRLSAGTLLVQGIATSIDALSVGFTIADYEAGAALLAAGIIAVVTFLICMAGLAFGKRFGEKLADKATVVGGLILIAIGLEIFITGIHG